MKRMNNQKKFALKPTVASTLLALLGVAGLPEMADEAAQKAAEAAAKAAASAEPSKRPDDALTESAT